VWSSVSAGEEWELCTCVKEGVDHARTRAPARHGRSITYLTPAVVDGRCGRRLSRDPSFTRCDSAGGAGGAIAVREPGTRVYGWCMVRPACEHWLSLLPHRALRGARLQPSLVIEPVDYFASSAAATLDGH
jgi:hypothetical protein